ncbi:MAG TPA: diadenylate cyclase [Eubacteriales bacterium]|nr:diadenylate cyclase [Eubacteriales bacterium]
MTFFEYCQSIIASFEWQWIVELVLLAFLFYWLWAFFKKRNAVWLAYITFLALVLIFILSIFDFVGARVYVAMFILAFAIIPTTLFASDMRRGLFRMSWKNFLNPSNKNIDLSHEDITQTVENIVRACQNMSKNDIGSLIVITNKSLDTIVETGTALGSLLTSELIETIFFPKSPLHDGAIIVTANRIIAAGCYLPLSARNDLPKEFGTRHRAAIGMSESNPSITAIVVSEESGIISAMHDGKILRYLDNVLLTQIVTHALVAENDKVEELALWGE